MASNKLNPDWWTETPRDLILHDQIWFNTIRALISVESRSGLRIVDVTLDRLIREGLIDRDEKEVSVRKISSLLIVAGHSFKFWFIPLQFSLSKSQLTFVSLPYPPLHDLTNHIKRRAQDDIGTNSQKHSHTLIGLVESS